MKIQQRKSKKSDPASKLVLEEIIGLSTKNANGLASNILTGDCVYIAGCVVVVYNVDSGIQSHLMVSSRMPKPLSCVAVSNQDGGFIAAGESGHQPAVLVWDYATRSFRFELKVHSYGVACIAFSSDGKHLVSVGFPHDGYFCLWDLRSGRLVTKLKSSSSCSVISAVSFSSDAHFFITAGKKHLKFWTVGSSTRPNSNTAGFPAIDGKSANLGLHKGSSFISVTSAITNSHVAVGRVRVPEIYPFFALTDTGVLCLLDSGFSIKMSVNLKVDKSFALSVSNKLIACGCSNGLVQLYAIENLEFAGSLQYYDAKDHPKSTILTSDMKSSEKQFDPVLPDAIACQFSTSGKLVVVYGNHSLYVWDVRDVNKVSRCAVLVSHSACIWDVKNLSCENMHDPALACVARGCCGGVSFATCSADGTIRFWDLSLKTELDKKTEKSQGCLDSDEGGSVRLVSAGTFERDLVESGISTQGFRSMAVSSDGKYLAAGDSGGNLHIYNLDTADYTCIQDAHDAEILSLTFSFPSQNYTNSEKMVSDYKYLLGSGGRDRMIHLYDVKRGFELIESLDDHSAAVTSVKLTGDGSKILSCSADRSLVFRDVAITDTGCKISRCHHQIASNGTVYDMAIDPSAEVAVTVGQDKKINTFRISSGKLIKTFKQDGDLGEPIKVSMDPSSSYLVCSYSNRSVCIYDFGTGELVTQVVGHSEVITGVIFLPDCKHIVSVGGDGCIFVWKVPSFLSSKMLQNVKELAGSLSPTSIPTQEVSSECVFQEDRHSSNINSKEVSFQENIDLVPKRLLPPVAPGFRFSISRLPNWARSKVTTDVLPGHPESTSLREEEPESPSPSMTSNIQNSAARGIIEAHSPRKQHLGTSNICPTNIPKRLYEGDADRNSLVSHDVPSFAMDQRWLTVHTVYGDLLGSPDGRNLQDKKVTAPDLQDNPGWEGPNDDEDVEFTTDDPTTTSHVRSKFSCGSRNHVVDDGHCQPLSQIVLRGIRSNSYEDKDFSVVSCEKTCSYISSEQLCSETRETLVQTTKVDADSSGSHQDDDLFSQHFSTLSTALKIEGRRSARRNYSARFVVRRDQLTGCRKLFETCNELSGELFDSQDEAAPHISSGETQLLEQPMDTSKQEISENLPIPASSPPQRVPITYSLIDHPFTAEKIEDDLEVAEVQKALKECKEALVRLDAAATLTIDSFSKLGSIVNGEDTRCLHRTEFNDWAAELLPSITEKLHSLGNLVHSSSRSFCASANSESSRFEPLVEKFAESLSRQVLELVRKNL